MDIRDSFSRNKIPLDHKKPTSYFYAIIRLIKEVFIKLEVDIEKYEEKLEEQQFGTFRRKLEQLELEKEEIESQINEAIKLVDYQTRRIENQKKIIFATIVILISFFPLIYRQILTGISVEYLIAASGLSLTYFWLIFETLIRNRSKKIKIAETNINDLSHKRDLIKVEIDKYTTLYITDKKKLIK